MGPSNSTQASTAQALHATVRAAAERFQRISDSEAAARPSPGRWSRKEILGHLIDSASNNHQRFVRAQLGSDLRFPGYEQDAWARSQDHASADWSLLVDLWESYNRHLAHVISRIPARCLATPCRIGDDRAVTLESMVADYLRHLCHHIAQIDADRS